jgi:amidase
MLQSDPASASIADLQASMQAGEIRAMDLVEACLQRIATLDRDGPTIRAMLQTNPDASDIAVALDSERRERGPRGPLHGIPILLKDNIDTADAMETTAGSLALVGVQRSRDAFVAQRLRDAGAVLLGKTNMSEWANFRSSKSSSGWSARGGQGLNPYRLDRSPAGSSSGSAQAVAAGYAPASLGTETSGSIISPAAMCGTVGIKPTVGLTSRAGVIPVAHSQDTVGTMARSVEDAALVLSAISGPDPRDPATRSEAMVSSVNFLPHLDVNGLQGARIGVPRHGLFGYSEEADSVTEKALGIMRDLGATIIDPADIPSYDRIREEKLMFEVLLHEFKADLNEYLAALGPTAPIRSLEDLIQFNRDNAVAEMPHFGQEYFELAQEKPPLTDPGYGTILASSRRLSREEGIDAVMDELRLDVLVAPAASPAFPIDLEGGDTYAGGSAGVPAMAGYPVVTVPAGYANDLPIGISFIGRAWSEPVLLRLAYAFEAAAGDRQLPRFLPAPDTKEPG